MKKICLVLAILMVFLSVPNFPVNAKDRVTESPNVKVSIDGKIVIYKNVPITVNSRTLLPLREFLISIGIPDDNEHISWNGREKSVTVKLDTTKVYLKIGDSKAQVNDSEVVLDTTPCIYKNSTYIPVRFVSQCFNKRVDWDNKTSTINITGNINSEKDTAAYDTKPDSWSTKANMPFEFISMPVTMTSGGNTGVLKWTEYSNASGKAVSVGSNIYIINSDGKVAEFNSKLNSWSVIGDIPDLENTKGCFKLVSLDNMIYIIGKDFNEILKYDPVNDECESVATLPTKRIVGGAVVANNKIYILAGIDMEKLTTLDTVEEYDPATNKITLKKSMPMSVNKVNVTSLNGKIYILGTAKNFKTEIQEHDIEKDCWTSKASLASVWFGSSIDSANGKIYLPGESTNNQDKDSTDKMEQYDPVSDTVTEMSSSMSMEKGGYASVVCNGRIYYIGVANSKAVLEYTPAQ